MAVTAFRGLTEVLLVMLVVLEEKIIDIETATSVIMELGEETHQYLVRATTHNHAVQHCIHQKTHVIKGYLVVIVIVIGSQIAQRTSGFRRR